MSWPSASTTTLSPGFSCRLIDLLVVPVGDDRAVKHVDLVGRAVDRLDGDLVRLHGHDVPTILNFSWADATVADDGDERSRDQPGTHSPL